MSSKIIVTGGCGFVGHPLTTALLELGHRVLVIDAMWFGNLLPEHENLEIIESDIRNLEEACFDGVDTVFHLANLLLPKPNNEVGHPQGHICNLKMKMGLHALVSAVHLHPVLLPIA